MYFIEFHKVLLIDYLYQQCSGFGCQQLKSTRWVEVAHEVDFPSSVLAFSCNPISVQDSIFTDT
jgi:hypothetical protein